VTRNIIAIALALAAANAQAATAFLVSSRTGSSVTGQAVWICTYQYGGQHFERVFPLSTMCPMSVEVY